MSLTIKNKNSKNKGFTLVELMVSIGIMILVLILILTNYNKFNNSIVLSNLAYDVGLSVRETQTYGTAVKGANTTGDQIFDNPYGISFDLSNSSTTYTIFTDLNSNGAYSGGSSGNCAATEGCIEQDNIQKGYEISALCQITDGYDGGTNNSQNYDCSDTNTSLTALSITFTRPNPDAIFYSGFNASNVSSTTPSAVAIKLVSTKDDSVTEEVVVRPTGQISVQKAP